MTTEEEWQRCRPWIEAALAESPGLETIEEVERLIACGRYIFWPHQDCAVITRVDQFEWARVLMAVHGGGKLGALMDELIPEMEKWAKVNDFDYFGGEGRLGWIPTLKKMGYKVAFVTMLKPLKDT